MNVAINKNLVQAFAEEVVNGTSVEVISKEMAQRVASRVYTLTKVFVGIEKVDTGINRREIYRVG